MKTHALVMNPSNFCTLEVALLLTPVNLTWPLAVASCSFKRFSVRTATVEEAAAGPRLAWYSLLTSRSGALPSGMTSRPPVWRLRASRPVVAWIDPVVVPGAKDLEPRKSLLLLLKAFEGSISSEWPGNWYWGSRGLVFLLVVVPFLREPPWAPSISLV